MTRIQHIKLVTNAPDEVREFLRDVADFPEGFDIAPYGADSTDNVQTRAKVVPSGPDLSFEDIASTRGMTGGPGFIAGSVESRQLQVFESPVPGVWAIALATRDLEGVHAKCRERGLPTTPVLATPFNGNTVRAFFVIVGGITFEFMRVEPLDPFVGKESPAHDPTQALG